MKKEEIVAKIKKAAQKDKKRRRDPRYRNTMAFLVNKGFLRANQKFPMGGNVRIAIEDAIWAGQNIEPRILEVLPAAVIRLNKHFVLGKNRTKEMINLEETINDLRELKEQGRDFLGIRYDKIKIWVNFKLKDGRIKTQVDKKIARNYRLRPKTIEILKNKALASKISDTEYLENLILKSNL